MKGIAAVLYRDYRQRLTNVTFVFWDLLAPMAYLLLFGLGFDRTVGPLALAGREKNLAPFSYIASSARCAPAWACAKRC